MKFIFSLTGNGLKETRDREGDQQESGLFHGGGHSGYLFSPKTVFNFIPKDFSDEFPQLEMDTLSRLTLVLAWLG